MVENLRQNGPHLVGGDKLKDYVIPTSSGTSLESHCVIFHESFEEECLFFSKYGEMTNRLKR